MPGIKELFKNKKKTNLGVPTYLELHLTECFHREGITIPPKAFTYIREAMKDFAAWNIREYNKKQRNDMLWVFANLPRFFLLTKWKVQEMWIRKQFFKMSKKEAIARADSEGYKVYVIRDSKYRFKTFSTIDFDRAKTFRVFKKNITAKDIQRTAAFTAYPKGAAGTGEKIVRPKRNTNHQLKKKRNR